MVTDYSWWPCSGFTITLSKFSLSFEHLQPSDTNHQVGAYQKGYLSGWRILPFQLMFPILYALFRIPLYRKVSNLAKQNFCDGTAARCVSESLNQSIQKNLSGLEKFPYLLICLLCPKICSRGNFCAAIAKTKHNFHINYISTVGLQHGGMTPAGLHHGDSQQIDLGLSTGVMTPAGLHHGGRLRIE